MLTAYKIAPLAKFAFLPLPQKAFNRHLEGSQPALAVQWIWRANTLADNYLHYLHLFTLTFHNKYTVLDLKNWILIIFGREANPDVFQHLVFWCKDEEEEEEKKIAESDLFIYSSV